MPAELKTTMDKDFLKAEQSNAVALSQRIEDTIPGAKVTNMGWLILVRLENGSIFTLAPLTSEKCDLNGTDCLDLKHELQAVAWNDALRLLQDVGTLQTEQSSTGAVAPTVQPVATTKRKVSETIRTENPFGKNPLGQDRYEAKPRQTFDRHSTRSPLTLSEISGSTETPQVLEYLSEMLPADSATIANGELVVVIDMVKIVFTSQANGNFLVRSFVDGEAVQEAENVTAGDLVKWAFEICGQIQSRVAECDSKGADVEPSDVHSVLKELAKETGAYGGDDILRNKSLTDLKGLCVSRPPFDRQQSPASFAGNVTESLVRGGTWHNGHPVRLCENNAAKPYGNGLSGKKLVYTLNEGATLVDADKLPPKMKLSYDDKHGVVMVPETQPTKRPSWYFRGHGRH